MMAQPWSADASSLNVRPTLPSALDHLDTFTASLYDRKTRGETIDPDDVDQHGNPLWAVQGWIDGDEAACSYLYAKYLGSLTGFLAKYGHSVDLGAEMAQRVFVRAWERRALFDGKAFEPWLFQIGVHMMHDLWRHESIVRINPGGLGQPVYYNATRGQSSLTVAGNTESVDLLTYGLETYGPFLRTSLPPEPEKVFERRQLWRELRSAVARIAPVWAHAFRLQQDEGLTNEEIGERMGRSTKSIKSMMWRARDAIAKEVARHPDDFPCILEWLAIHGTKERAALARHAA